MNYITWEYYSSLFTEVSDKEEFERIGKRAELKLDAVTHMRARRFETEFQRKTATDFQKQIHEQIKNTICELINIIYAQETSGMGTGIASVSNDGYSESYKITTAAEKEAQIHSVIRTGLSGTGLAGAL